LHISARAVHFVSIVRTLALALAKKLGAEVLLDINGLHVWFLGSGH
jgi:hypothetical protein